jgi:hypothetical protein
VRRRINEGWKSGRRAQHKFERTEGPSPEVNSILASWSELRETRGLKKEKNGGKRIGKRKKRERKGERGDGEAGRRLPRSLASSPNVDDIAFPSLPLPPSTQLHATTTILMQQQFISSLQTCSQIIPSSFQQ